jgi:serine/threonine protein kinase
VVKLARHVFTGEKVAVKVIDKQKLDQSTQTQMLQEVKLMKLVQHPNVVRLYEVSINYGVRFTRKLCSMNANLSLNLAKSTCDKRKPSVHED